MPIPFLFERIDTIRHQLSYIVFIAFIALLSGYAGATDAGICRGMLEAHPDIARRLKLTADLAPKLSADHQRLVAAAVKILGETDEHLWVSLAQSLVANTAPIEASDIAQNPFFVLHPSLRTSFNDVSYTILKSEFSDAYNDYELGLLSSAVPRFARMAKVEVPTVGMKPLALAFQAMLDSPDYRPALFELAEHILGNHSFRMSFYQVAPLISPEVGSQLTIAHVERALVLLKKGKAKELDLAAVKILFSGFFNNITAHLLSDDWSESGSRTYGDIGVQSSREWGLHQIERYFASKTEFKASASSLMVVYGAIGWGNPIPPSGMYLRQVVLEGVEKLIFPVRQSLKMNANTTPSKAGQSPIKESFSFNPADEFAPRPEKIRLKTRKALESETRSETKYAESVSPYLGVAQLRSYTSFLGQDSLPPSGLKEGVTYNFHYLRTLGSLEFGVIFSREVLSWMNDNPRFAQKIVNAIAMGRSQDGLPGFKLMVDARSKQFCGPIFEVKIYGPFRPLAILINGIWQILAVVHKDEISHRMDWLSPL